MRRPLAAFFIQATSALLLGVSNLSATPPTPSAGFPVTLSGALVYSSAPAFADLNGDRRREVVVGSSSGTVFAFEGDGDLLWQYDTGSTSIDSKPAIADIDLDGFPEVVVGAGSAFVPGSTPGVFVISHTGSLQCSFSTYLPGSENEGVYSSPALAELDFDDLGQREIAFGSWDFKIRVINHDCTAKYSANLTDSVWSSPAIGDLDGDGLPEIVIGGDHNPGGTAEDGGQVHAYRRDLSSELPGFPILLDEVVYSSPALGDLDGDGQMDLVVGTGWCWDRPSCAPLGVTHGVAEAVYAFDRLGNPLDGWPVALTPTEYAFGSPALADFDGDSDAEVVFNTLQKVEPPTAPEGWVHVVDGDGSSLVGWPRQPSTPATCDTQVHYGTLASPLIADLDGDGTLEVALPSNWEIVVWNASGEQISRDDACPEPPGDWILATDGPVAAIGVGDIDGDGAAEIVASGFNAAGSAGRLHSWGFGAAALGAQKPWPQFRRAAMNHARFAADLFAEDFETGDYGEWGTIGP